ncbi:hypothetical protein NMY22_g18452 [Coprinellus aureogranulatus]|nr:hypothetical protein NMY22_g18452 [Coprinellus aureogranulatus]
MTLSPLSNTLGRRSWRLDTPLRSESDTIAGPKSKWIRCQLAERGTYGRVYCGRRRGTAEVFATVNEFPIISKPRRGHERAIAAIVKGLQEEWKNLQRLGHPHILRFFALEETSSNMSLLFEHFEGRSLASWVQMRGPFADMVTRSFTKQILDGLGYLHSKGIIHGDLQSEHIQVDMKGVCKISGIDFSSATFGAVYWMAPEVVRLELGSKQYASAANIWSVGCLVIEMLTGARPWSGHNLYHAAYELRKGHAPEFFLHDAWSMITHSARNFRENSRCFAANPDERPPAWKLKTYPYLRIPKNWHFKGFTVLCYTVW